jgi:hypothetical protein
MDLFHGFHMDSTWNMFGPTMEWDSFHMEWGSFHMEWDSFHREWDSFHMEWDSFHREWDSFHTEWDAIVICFLVLGSSIWFGLSSIFGKTKAKTKRL